ncbi:MAG: DUF2191 domain-containing protein [Solirubrobacteraceae bacterium]
MRTTLTLDDDVADALRALAHARQQPFKRVVNETIRSGLATEQPTPMRFRQTTSAIGALPGVDLVKALTLAAAMEDEEIARKLEQGR